MRCVLVFDTRRRQSWRTRQAASPLSGCARKRRDKHTPFLNYGKINRQRAKICADPLANSSPFSLSSYILLIPYPHYRRFPLLYSVYFQVIFKRLKIFICNRDVCLSLIRERVRTRAREERDESSLNCLAINEIFYPRNSCFRLCDCGTLFFRSQREKIFLLL